MKPTPPLDEGQRRLVESQMDEAASIAFGVWKESHLPASVLEEMRAEAMLQLCVCCSRQRRKSGKVLCGIQIRQACVEVAKRWRASRKNSQERPGDPVDRPDRVADDPRLVLALKLVSWLPGKQRTVAELRFGLSGPPLSNREVAAKLGIGDAGASGLHAKALRKLTEWASWEIWESFKREEGEGAR